MEILNDVLFMRVVEAENKMDAPTKELAERYYWLIEDQLPQHKSMNETLRTIHVALKHTGYHRSRTTMIGYHAVVQWLFEQRGAVEWVENRTFTQHLWALSKHNQMSWDELAEAEPKFTGTSGAFHEQTIFTKALDLRTRADHTVKHMEMEVEFSRGHKRKLLREAIPALTEAEAIIDEAVKALVGA